MRKISKGNEPESLMVLKLRNPNQRYANLSHEVRRAIRAQALAEQFFLCAHCCQSINIDDCHNEHLVAQNLNQARTLDFSNIVASCNTPNQCGDSHKSQPLPLTPLMDECETELKFKISGRVDGLTERAKTTIQVLNLGEHERQNRALVEKRKQLSHAVLLKNGIEPNEGLEDDVLLQMVIEDISQPIEGKLDPFAPVVINILRGWLAA